MNHEVDHVITKSEELVQEFKNDIALKRSLHKLIDRPMPNKGNVVGVKELENLEAQTYNENIEEKRNIELMFTREKPKAPLYSKFARPSTGKHSIY